MAPELWTATAGYRAPPVDCWAYGVLVFTSLSGFAPWGEAYATDSTFVRFEQSVASGAGACDVLYGMYDLRCPFSPPACDFIDGLLTIDANARATVTQCLNHPWLAPPPPAAEQHEDVVYRTASAQRASTAEEDGLAPPPPPNAPRPARQYACAPST